MTNVAETPAFPAIFRTLNPIMWLVNLDRAIGPSRAPCTDSLTSRSARTPRATAKDTSLVMKPRAHSQNQIVRRPLPDAPDPMLLKGNPMSILQSAAPSATSSPSLLRRMSALAAAILRCHELYRQRRGLKVLDDAMLRDIGLSRHEALTEAARPIWDVPTHWRR